MAQQPGRNRQQIIQNLHEEPGGVDACVVPPAQPAATQQRLRIHIPDPRTTLLLGQRILGGNPFGYPGVSLQTVENLFADIQKSTVLQSHGSMLLQTGAQWQQYASKLMELSSREAVKVAGGRVWIGAIDNPHGCNLKHSHGEGLQLNLANDLESCNHDMLEIQKWGERVAALLAAVYSALFCVYSGSSKDKVQTSEAWLSSGAAFWYNYIRPIVMPDPDSPRDVNIYGKDGVKVTSPSSVVLATSDTMSLCALQGVTMTSLMPSTVQSVWGVRCLGGVVASLEAGGYASVKAIEGVDVSSLRGSVNVSGKIIKLGSAEPAGQARADGQQAGNETAAGIRGRLKRVTDSVFKTRQAPTETLEVMATQVISVDAGKSIHIKAATPTDKTKGKDSSSRQSVLIQVGPYSLEVEPGGIKIGKWSNGVSSDPTVTINENNIVIKRGDMHVKITPKRVQLGMPPDGHFTIKNGNATVKGKRIQLG